MNPNYTKLLLCVLLFSTNCMYDQQKNSGSPLLVYLISDSLTNSTAADALSQVTCTTKSFDFNSGIPECWTSSWYSGSTFCPSGGSSLCLISSAIGNGKFVNAQFKAVTNSGNITFNRRVSSESGYDFCKFSIDGVTPTSESNGVSGTLDRSNSFAVTAGTHTFLWTYTKDNYDAFGTDQCAIDNVVIP